ncbi:hypothetical protein [Brunnivagina elsteri]|uniref:Alpha/beta hydrolase n=1 Tax=Brunnivagina elsteri CCALA 953 TaxID=987040 RepID=A0A2A2TJU3_9CYAN|nr:hypothetical protein [Calothrix elsteri]PAX55843.1 hypothetical protein CK510_10990 [Calothrix elsteri CCALA 953]
MTIIICPGIHEQALTDGFVSQLFGDNSNQINYPNILVFPNEGILPVSGLHLLDFLDKNIRNKQTTPITLISFSAGVIGALIAAYLWELQGGKVRSFIAIDGWGVPLFANFPIYRLSHDYFTHWSSLLLGGGETNFYAEPSVNHLEMWSNPQMVKGICISLSTSLSTVELPEQTYGTASDFLQVILNNKEEK